MLKWTVIRALLAGLVTWLTNRLQRRAYKKQGAMEQHVKDLEASVERTKEAQANRDDVARIPDSGIDDRLRKYQRNK